MPGQAAVTLHRVAAFCFTRSWFFEIDRVLVLLYHVASFIVNVNHSIVVHGCAGWRSRLHCLQRSVLIPEATEGQRMGN